METKLVELDGSFGEGGGQILRSSLALALLTGQAFRLRNIRAKRDKPGLRPQHLMSVRAAAEVLAQPFDQGVIDGAVNGVAALVAGAAGRLRKVQTGFVRNYALTLLSGATVVLFVFLVRGSI